jgi:hypothetical protein
MAQLLFEIPAADVVWTARGLACRDNEESSAKVRRYLECDKRGRRVAPLRCVNGT